MAKLTRISAIAALALGAFLLFILRTDGFARYESWRSLAPEHVSDATQWYIANRVPYAGDVTAVCVYVPDCREDRARLAIVQAPDQYDFGALRRLIWARRFEGRCEGQTANLGLQILRRPESDHHLRPEHAIWSFYQDRFIPREGRFSSAAFSEEPWERCTPERATYEVQDGQLSGTGN